MSLSPLKFSLGVSVLAHGLILGGAAWLGKFERTPAVLATGDRLALELIAAPASTPEAVVSTPTSVMLPAPTTAPLALPPEELIPEKIPEPTPVEAATIPLPAPPVQPVATPQLPVRSVISVSEPATVSTPTTVPGDNSSPTPGPDFTSAVGSPAAKAKPDYLKNPEPEYPLQARRRGQEGLVLLNVTVNASGRATEITLKQSSGYDLLDQAAIKAVRAWEFEPARIGSVGVASKIEVPVRFKLTR